MVFALILSASACRSVSNPSAPAPPIVSAPHRPSVGLNKFELALQYTGRGNECRLTDENCYKVSKAMAKKSIIDAKNIGVTYFRVAVTGYGPANWNGSGDLELWQNQPAVYWSRMDEMINDVDRFGIALIPVFVWHNRQFPAITGDTLTEFMTKADSASYRLLKKYLAEFITRYRQRQTIYFYELTNEVDLDADLDLQGNCQKKDSGSCQILGNGYTTDQLIDWTKRLTAEIRQLDSKHLISSGFSMPKRNAEYLRLNHPKAQEIDWTKEDTLEQFQKNLTDLHQYCDIVSIHFYNGGPNSKGRYENERFGMIGKNSAGVLILVKEITDRLGKPLFIGEFGEADPFSYRFAENAPFFENTLEQIARLKIPHSAPWAWEFYQFNTYTPYRLGGVSNIEPGYADHLIAKIKGANAALGQPPPSYLGDDLTPPQLVITWPFEQVVVSDRQLIHAVASDDRGLVDRVEFWLDDQEYPLTIVHQPPFETEQETAYWPKGQHTIAAKAYDPTGNSAAYHLTVIKN